MKGDSSAQRSPVLLECGNCKQLKPHETVWDCNECGSWVCGGCLPDGSGGVKCPTCMDAQRAELSDG